MKNSILVLFICALFAGVTLQTSYAQITFGTGKMNVRVDDYGALRIFTTEGADTIQHINRASVLVAGNLNQVLDYWNDLDIEVPIELVASPLISDYEVSGTFNNQFSSDPPNVLVEQHVYGWANKNYCIVKMIVKNQESSPLPTLIGLDIIQYVDETWENDNILYDQTNQMLVQYEMHHIGIKILSEQTTSAQILAWYSDYEVDSSYYQWLTAGSFTPGTLVTTADGGIGILGGESMIQQPAGTRTIYFAIAAGTDGNDLIANMNDAVTKYNTITSVESDNSLPSSYSLAQNYPNPFNPSTKIDYQIPESGFVAVKVYNLLGKEVTSLVNEEQSAGKYTLNFNGDGLSSGVYFYKIQSGSFNETKKMILIK